MEACGMKEGSGRNWSLSRDDLLRARFDLNQQQVELQARHAEELQALTEKHAQEGRDLEARVAKIDELERVLDAFVAEHLQEAETVHESPRVGEVSATVH
jgi:hypothetical protein